MPCGCAGVRVCLFCDVDMEIARMRAAGYRRARRLSEIRDEEFFAAVEMTREPPRGPVQISPEALAEHDGPL